MDIKKVRTSAIAVLAAAAITLSGTFAWTSISQQALNEAKSEANPGGRLHDDFSGYNTASVTDKTKDIYVENFGSEGDPVIYARVRLDEYMEVGTGAGLKTGEDGADTKNAVSLVEGADINDVATWTTHIPSSTNVADPEDDVTDPFHDYWTWTMGGQTVYMPTFNKNKDSLSADINGTLEGQTEGDTTYYDDYTSYTSGQTLEGTAYYDADSNTQDEYEEGTSAAPGAGGVDGTNWTSATETHTAAETLSATVITMAEYNKKSADEKATFVGWVYDTDGWAYWSQPIEPGTATGLLLDSIKLENVPSDSWYYAINAVGQFITAEEVAVLADDITPDGWALLNGIGATGAVNVALTGETAETAAASTIAAGNYSTYSVSVTDAKDNEITEGVTYSWTAANTAGNAITGVELSEATASYTVVAATEVTSKSVILTVADTVPNGTEIVLTCNITVDGTKYVKTQTVTVNAAGVTTITGSDTIEAGSKALYTTDATSATNSAVAAADITWKATDSDGAAITGVTVYRGQLIVTSDVAADTVITLSATVGGKTATKTVTVTADDGVYDVGDLYTLDSLNFIVVAKDETNNKLLLVLDAMSQTHAYNSKSSEGNEVMTSWADSEIEEWLNNSESGWLSGKTEIANAALETTITVRNVDGTMPTEGVSNKIFLLSEADVFGTSYGGTKTPEASEYTYNGARLAYFETAEARMGRNQSGAAWSCWLRSPYSSSIVSSVNFASGGRNGAVPSLQTGVRPAFWVNIPDQSSSDPTS